MTAVGYLTPREVSLRLHVSGATVRKWIARGWLDAYRVGGRVRISWEAYDRFVRSGITNGTHAERASA